jgi:hypothetical protein
LAERQASNVGHLYDGFLNFQDMTVSLQKIKETYKQRCLEMEKLKRDNASTKELEKSEAKFRKAQVILKKHSY